jgi:hypothetical protein
MTARIEEIMQDEKNRLERDQEEAKQMQDRLFKLEVQQIQTQGKNNILKKRINDLEATIQLQTDEIDNLQQQGTTPRDNPRTDPGLATPEPINRRKDERENDDRCCTPQRENRHNDQGDNTPQQERPHGNRWNIDPQTINPRRNPTNELSNDRENASSWSNERSTGRTNERDHLMSRDERAAMELSIRGFEKKLSSIVELADEPSKLSIKTMHRHLAHQANNSGLPVRTINEIERGCPTHPESALQQPHSQALRP